MNHRNNAAITPPKTGEITQLAAILVIVPQFTALKSAAAMPAPITPPTTEWVVETGAPIHVARFIHKAAASNAAIIAQINSEADCIALGSIMPFAIVETTSPPAIKAPALSKIIYQKDKIIAARRWVPVLVGIMAGVFASYLALKGIKKIIKIDLLTAVYIGLAIGGVVWLLMRPIIRRQSEGLENRNRSLKILFNIPLIVSAALLSFAHGANDVANAVGPLAAIVQASSTGEYLSPASIPLWVMVIGAAGISFGLFLFGPKLIKVVGSQITKLNQMRAYCVALSAAITVIVASWLGLPVSSTHIAVGSVFGVGFFREWDTSRRMKISRAEKFEALDLEHDERKRRKLVRRSHFMSIIAAWIITVPAAALISGLIYILIIALM